MNNKSKLLNSILILCLLPTVCACKKEIPTHEKQGFVQEVVYNLGDGIYRGNNRDTNMLTLYFKPGSYITDITLNRSYPIECEGHYLDGWYLDEEYNTKVDFNNYTLSENTTEPVQLYAKWNVIVHRYLDLYYVKDGVTTLYNSVPWNDNTPYTYSKAIFPNPYDTTYTYIDAYKDEAMTEKVDNSYVLDDTTGDHLPIYTKWLEGNFKVIKTAKDFTRSLGSYSLYIDADLDLGGASIGSAYTFKNQKIYGNGHTISNVTYTTLGKENNSKQTVTLGLFASKLEDCEIKDLTFNNVTYTLDVATCRNLQLGLLAGEITNCDIENVNINGSIVYSENIKKRLASDGIDKLESSDEKQEIAYAIDSDSTVSNCVFNVIVNKGE